MRAREKESGQRVSTEGDGFAIDSGAREQLQMTRQHLLAGEGCENQTPRILPSHRGESHGRVVDREGQMLFEGEGHNLAQPPAIGEGQGEQTFGDLLTGQRADA